MVDYRQEESYNEKQMFISNIINNDSIDVASECHAGKALTNMQNPYKNCG